MDISDYFQANNVVPKGIQTQAVRPAVWPLAATKITKSYKNLFFLISDFIQAFMLISEF